jgi:hypothetical protein
MCQNMLNFKTTRKWIDGQQNNDQWGKADTLNYLAALGYKPGDSFWIKFNSVEPFHCVINKDFTNWSTFVTHKDYDGSWQRGYEHKDGYQWLHYRSSTRTICGKDSYGDDIFVLPNKMGQGIDAARFQGATTIFVDIDEDDLPTQKARIERVEQEFGLTPCAVVFSGGKSYHVYYRINTLLMDVDTWKRIQKRLIVILKGDVTIHNVNREMRLPGFNRDSKQSFQELVFTSDCQYSVEEIDNKLAIAVPNMSDSHWQKYNRLRHQIKESTDTEVIAQLEAEIVALFAKTEDEVKPARRQYSGNAGNFVYTELDGEVPSLYYFLSPQYKDLVQSGVTSGGVGREPMLRNIALMLGSAKATLELMGAAHADDVYNVLTTFAGNCSPALTEFEVEKHYQRALSVGANSEYIGMYNAIYTKWVKENRPDVEVEVSNNVVAISEVSADEAKELHWRQSAEYQQIEANQEFFESDVLAKAENTIRIDEWKNQQSDRNARNWDNLRKFTPTITFHADYVSQGFDLAATPKQSIVAIKSDLGTGKTTALVEACKQWELDPVWVPPVNLNSRNGLGIQTSFKLGGLHIHADAPDFFEGVKNGKKAIALCMDSVHKLIGHEDRFDNADIFVDEVNSVLYHFLINPNFKQRELTQKVLKEMGDRANRIILMDGNINDYVVNFFEALFPNKQVIKVENTKKTSPTTIYFYLGTAKENYEGNFDLSAPEFKNPGIDYRDVSAMKAAIFANEKKFCVASDSCAELTAIFNELQKLHPHLKGLLVTSDTAAEKDVVALLRNPEQKLITEQYDYVLYSPTAESGVDISIRNYFENQYCFFFNVINASQVKQMIFRIRDENCVRHVWISNHAVGVSHDFADGKADVWQHAQIQQQAALLQEVAEYQKKLGVVMTREEINETIDEKESSFVHECQSKLYAQDLYERVNGQKCVFQLIEESNHKVVYKVLENPDITISDRLKEAKLEIKIQECDRIVNAPELSDDEYQNIKANPGATRTEKAAATKYEDDHKFPAISKYECYGTDFIFEAKFANPMLMSAIQHRWMFEHIDIAKQVQNNRVIKDIQRRKKYGDSGLSLVDTKFDLLKVIALKEVGFDFFTNPESQWNCHSPEVKELIKKINNLAFQEKMGMQVIVTGNRKKPKTFNAQNITKFINKWLEWLGFATRTQRQRIDGEQFAFVSINADKSFTQYTSALLECLDSKYIDNINGKVENLLYKKPESKTEPLKAVHYQPTLELAIA